MRGTERGGRKSGRAKRRGERETKVVRGKKRSGEEEWGQTRRKESERGVRGRMIEGGRE